MLDRAGLPAFIIGGAAKSGTSTLHDMLGRRPDVFIPERELYFFSIDDYEQHPEFFVDADGSWAVRDYDAHRDEYLAWYRGFFRDAPPDAMVGEDSTSYLPSARAPERIRELLPEVKLIFLLRDPATRTYSQYWHDLRVGRVVDDFERTLRFAPGTLLQRSRYREHATRYLDHFPAAQLRFFLFEDLVREPEIVLRQVSDFLGLAPLPARAGETAVHRNPARVPRSIRLQLLRNRLFRDRAATRFQGFLPGTATPSTLGERAIRGRWARFALRTDRRPPPMRPDTRRFLDELFAHENAGLDQLIGIDATQQWYRSAR
jgi:Sulfotransferase family